MWNLDHHICTKESTGEAWRIPQQQTYAHEAPHEPLSKRHNPIPSFVVNFNWAVKTSDRSDQSVGNHLCWPKSYLQAQLHGLQRFCCRELEKNIALVADIECTLSRSTSRNFSGYIQIYLKFSLANWNPPEKKARTMWVNFTPWKIEKK